MPDINLLPEDLKKKNNNSFNKRSDFGSKKVEFTSGALLKKDKEDDEIDAVDKLFSWVKPKIDNEDNVKEINIPKKQNLIIEKKSEITEKPYKIKFDKIENKVIKDKKQNFFSKLFSNKHSNTINTREKIKDVNINKINVKENSIQSISANKATFNPVINPLNNNFVLNNTKQNNILNNTNQTNNNFSNRQEKVLSNNFAPRKNLNFQTDNNQKINNIIVNTQNQKSGKIKKSKFSFKNLFSSKKQIKLAQDKDNNFDVNLLPEGINAPSGKNLLFVLLSTFILSCMALIVVYFALNIYEIKLVEQYKNIDIEVNSYESSVKFYDDLISEIQSWQTKINKIKTLFSHHVYWTKFFETIEANTMVDIKFSGFTGNVNGNLSLSAQAPNYEAVVKQWTYWNNAKNFVDSVIINGASLSSNGATQSVNFSVTFDFVDNIFYKTNKQVDNN